MTKTADQLTDSRVRALRDEALLAGDGVTADMCAIVLSGEDSDGSGTTLGVPCSVDHSRHQLIRVIRDAEAA